MESACPQTTTVQSAYRASSCDGSIEQQPGISVFYDVIHALLAVYRFKDFNAISVRQAGQTSALLVSMTDRFGNQLNIVRNSVTPSIIEKITRTNSGVDVILATFTYTGSVITRVVVHKAPTGDALPLA